MVERVRRVYDLMDANSDGVVTMEENSNHYLEIAPSGNPEFDQRHKDAVEKAYLGDDADGNGVVTLEEYASAWLAKEKANFSQLDVDGDSEVSFVEFMNRQPGSEAIGIGGVDGTSYRFGATNEEVGSPHPYFQKGPYDANFAAYMGHAFARWDKDESFTLSFDEYAGLD